MPHHELRPLARVTRNAVPEAIYNSFREDRLRGLSAHESHRYDRVVFSDLSAQNAGYIYRLGPCSQIATTVQRRST